MGKVIEQTDRIPVLEAYLEKFSALELARRSLLGAPVYTVVSLIMLVGTPMLMDYGWWSLAEVILLIMLGGIRVWFALHFPSRYEVVGERAVVQFSILTALQSLTLGVLSAMVIWQYWAAEEVMLTIVLSAGCIAAGTSALSVRRSAHIIFLACVLVPFGIAVFLVGGIAKALFIVGFLSLMAFLVQDGGQARSAYFQSLRDGYTQMINSRRAAMESKARNEFMRDVGHEIRTPVNSIIGVTALLLDEELTPKTLELAQKIRANSSSLLELVGNIPGTINSSLHMTEFQSGTTDLKRCIIGVTDLYAAAASGKGIELITQLDNLPEELLTSDNSELEQVLANLLANAVQFSENGCITLSSFSHFLKDGTFFLELSVADTGPGIPAEILQNVFDPFDQTGAKSSGKFGGCGLGLPLCKALVEQMGGEIWIESTEGEGTTIRFTMRIEVDPSFEDTLDRPDKNVAETFEETTYSDLSHKHPHSILVVDDDDIHRQIMCVQLSKFGYLPDEASDGDEAIAAVINGDYDLIFMDLRMPSMSGVESTLWIRERFNDRLGHPVRIVALTGDATVEARQQSVNAGMDGFLTKPANPEQIKAVLEYIKNDNTEAVIS
jgi:signal transduction histidine kinase/ActR/RegA family two-component response regulator